MGLMLLLAMTIPESILWGSGIIAVAVLIGARMIARRLSLPLFPSLPFPGLPELTPESLPTRSPGAPVTDDTPLEPGMPVLARWGSSWWNAEVIALAPQNQVKVHYRGWDDSWDEVVPRSRLQLDLSGSLPHDQRG